MLNMKRVIFAILFHVRKKCREYEVVFDITAQKMKLPIKDLFCKCDQICRKLRIGSYLLKEPLMEHFILCAVYSLTPYSIFVLCKCYCLMEM